jgi:PAS domain S-box-containing protein
MIRKTSYLQLQQKMRECEDRFRFLESEWAELLSGVSDETQRLAAVVRDSNDAITLQDLDGNIMAWNHGAEIMYGWTEEEALCMNIRQTIPASCQEDVLQLIARLAGGEMITSFETQRLTKDGRILEVWLTLTALKDVDQKIYAVASTERDITERKRAEAEKERYLQEALAKIKILTGFLPICSSCKRIRDPQGAWTQMESYIRERSEATFSHTLCPECSGRLYPPR